MNCSTCANLSTCVSLCQKVESFADKDYRGLFELSLASSVISITPSSCAHVPVNTGLPIFSELKQKENKMLELFYQEGLSYRKIGRRTKTKINTVKATLARAKTKLRAHIP